MRRLVHRCRSCLDELSGLTAELLDRSVAVQLALSGAIEAVIARDAERAAAVIAQHAAIPPLSVTEPLAVDVRMVRAALRIAAACARVSDHAVSIARSAQRLRARPPAAAAAELRELCRKTDLAQEPLGAEDGRELWAEDLECDGAIVLQVPGEIDRGHPAAPELTLDRVPAREGRPHAL